MANGEKAKPVGGRISINRLCCYFFSWLMCSIAVEKKYKTGKNEIMRECVYAIVLQKPTQRSTNRDGH